jgi:hypothetical protein
LKHVYYKLSRYFLHENPNVGIEHREYGLSVPMDTPVFYGLGAVKLTNPKNPGDAESRPVRFPLKATTVDDAFTETIAELEIIQRETQAEFEAFLKQQEAASAQPAILGADGAPSIFDKGG